MLQDYTVRSLEGSRYYDEGAFYRLNRIGFAFILVDVSMALVIKDIAVGLPLLLNEWQRV
jgi:hypothetical protein